MLCQNCIYFQTVLLLLFPPAPGNKHAKRQKENKSRKKQKDEIWITLGLCAMCCPFNDEKDSYLIQGGAGMWKCFLSKKHIISVSSFFFFCSKFLEYHLVLIGVSILVSSFEQDPWLDLDPYFCLLTDIGL